MFYNLLFSAAVFIVSYSYFRVAALNKVRNETNKELAKNAKK